MSPTEYTRYKVMVQMVNVLEWPTYCITRCKDEQCRALRRHWPSSAGVRPIFRNRTISWRHWPSYAGVRPTFDITPYHDVIPWRHWPSYAGVRPTFDITPYHDVIPWRLWPSYAGVRPIFWNHSKPTKLHWWVNPLIWYCVNDGDWIVWAGIFPIGWIKLTRFSLVDVECVLQRPQLRVK